MRPLTSLRIEFTIALAVLSLGLAREANAQNSATKPPVQESKPLKIAPLITTAEQLIKQIESGIDPETATLQKHGRYVFNQDLVVLSSTEKAQAIKMLRAKFPFESIKKRLVFQGEYEGKPLPPKKDPSLGGLFHTGPSRTEALKKLHSQEVESFIERDGQGMARMRVITPYDLKPMKFADRLNSIPVDSKIKGEEIVPLRRDRPIDAPIDQGFDLDRLVYSPGGLPSQDLVELYHLSNAEEFSSRTGLFKSIDQVAGFESHRVRLSSQTGAFNSVNKLPNAATAPHLYNSHKKELESQREIEWRTNRIQLIGLLMHDKPVVYASEQLPDMEKLSSKDAPTRVLNNFESDAIEYLGKQKNEETVTQATTNRILMVGAIRANNNCLQCHNVNVGQMLGAFSYEFLRHPQIANE